MTNTMRAVKNSTSSVSSMNSMNLTLRPENSMNSKMEKHKYDRLLFSFLLLSLLRPLSPSLPSSNSLCSRHWRIAMATERRDAAKDKRKTSHLLMIN